MVPRSGFYVRDNKIVQRVVNIDWNLGFDAHAKHQYIVRILQALGNDVGNAADVTSASYMWDAKQLSPLFVKMKDSNQTVEQYLQDIKQNKVSNVFELPGISDYVYISNLSEENKKVAMKYDCYIDVFHNPDKGYGNTQALSLALFRLLRQTGKEYVLNSPEDFLDWYEHLDLVTEYLEDEQYA